MLLEWLKWRQELKGRKKEIVATLVNEKMVSESCFLSEDNQFVFYFMEAEDFAHARKAADLSPFPIDSEHRKIRDACLEPVGKLEELFHFENRD